MKFPAGDLMLDSLIQKNKYKRVLLIDPAFPVANKSRNHKDLLPVGLLKISAYLKEKYEIKTKLVRLNNKHNFDNEILDFNPDFVMITSVFTYWFNEVKDAVDYSKKILPKIPVMVGGILPSLDATYCDNNLDCDYVFPGLVKGAEHIVPDYSILENNGEDINFQIVHASRGCKRQCGFCGVYKIEPERDFVGSIEKELCRKNLVFYDNNLLDNPNIENLLLELIRLREEKKITRCESQSGFDGRILRRKPKLADMLKAANFKDPKIAWDGHPRAYEKREEEINILKSAGYAPKEIAVFMIYNHDDLDYNQLEEKRAMCFNWGVQISDCRYRPLDWYYDGYNPHARKPQTDEEYYISPLWSDEEVRQFRRNVRRHNICIRHDMKYHSYKAERKQISKELSLECREWDYIKAKKILKDAWDPSVPYELHKMDNQSKLC